MRILFSGGASGGHVNPALAIAEIMKANYQGCEIAFVGTPDGIENSLVPQAGYELYKIKIEDTKRLRLCSQPFSFIIYLFL